MRHARDNDGFALVTAIILLSVMMGLGLGLLLLTDNQQKASAREQASESAFNVAEAALNAQIGQLSRSWPSEAGAEANYPKNGCTAASIASGCPSAKSLEVGYPSAGTTTCPASQKDAWGSATTNEWTTYVRNDVGGSPLFNSATEQTALTWAESGKVWVRSVGVVQCRVVVLVALVSPQYVSVPFPTSAVSGNWFETSNNGNKVIVDTKGKSSQAGGVSMRCNGFKGTEQEIKEKCEKWDEAHGQVSPNTTNAAANPSVTLSTAQLETLKSAAKAAGTYFPTGKCPESLAETKGNPAYVEGPCELSYNGGSGNSEKSPGFLVLVNGTFRLNGNAEFFGSIYAVNAQASAGVVVEAHGNSGITGGIDVDGNGGISFGSSKENFVYNDSAGEELKGFAGAAATRNSFRVLPITE
jgi:Tfp pilus assembly protein PilX